MYPASDDSAERAYPVERRALRDVLLREMADVIEFGKRFERYELQPNGEVTAWFSYGSRADGDLLVGADGSASQVRAQLCRGQAGKHRRGGVRAKLPLTPQTGLAAAELLDGETMIMTDDPFFLFTSVFQTVSEPEGMGAYLLCAFVARATCVPRDCGHRRAVDATGHRRCPALAPILRRLIVTSTDQRRDVSFATLMPPSWPTGQVTLLGNAIRLVPPTGGIGANTHPARRGPVDPRLVAAQRAILTCPADKRLRGRESRIWRWGRSLGLATLHKVSTPVP